MPTPPQIKSAAARSAASVVPAKPVALVHGDDEFAVKQRAKEIYQQWSTELGGMDHEIIEASVNNSGEALKAIARLREALQTLPFFGGGKAVWFKDCNFLDDGRTAKTGDVTETLTEFAQELKDFCWRGVRLLVSSGKPDKRKVFFKALDKLGSVETFEELSVNSRDWESQCELRVRRNVKERGKEIGGDALAELVARIGPNPRQLDSEVEKLTIYVGERKEISKADVNAVCIRNKLARSFALADALGDRDLPGLLKRLDEELWDMQFDKDKSEIGLLYGLISKVRTMLLLKEMIREGWVRADADYGSFQTQLKERVPANAFPAEKKFNPLAMHPYPLYRALGQAKNYSSDELVRAMDSLLECNRRLVLSNLDESLVLQQSLAQIIGTNVKQPARPGGARFAR